jgi:hypothetical protein
MNIEMPEDRTWCRWISYVREALSCLDEKANWLHLPEAGGLYDQDQFFMTIWQTVRIEYLLATRDETFLKTLRTQHGKS